MSSFFDFCVRLRGFNIGAMVASIILILVDKNPATMFLIIWCIINVMMLSLGLGVSYARRRSKNVQYAAYRPYSIFGGGTNSRR